MAEAPKQPDQKTDAAEPAKADLEFTLSSPIRAYGEEISVIKMRKPKGGDLIQIGNPVTWYPYVDPPKVEHDMVKMAAMITRLANIPSSSVEMIETRDLTGLAWALTPFFIPAL